jgi:hypothetical protein
MKSFVVSALILVVSLCVPRFASAQSFEVGAHAAFANWSEFEGTDKGVGGRLSFKPMPVLGIDADLTWYPGDYAPNRGPFSQRRVEGLFGVTVGPRIGRIRPFAKAAAGFLKVSPSGGAFACIAIFPPPLSCKLAGGDTLPAYEIGGGIEFDATSRLFIRGDIADRILQYPGPTFDDNFEIRDEDFFGHALRFTIGAGFRF